MHVRHVYIKTTGAVSIKAVRTACIYYTHTHVYILYTHTHIYTTIPCPPRHRFAAVATRYNNHRIPCARDLPDFRREKPRISAIDIRNDGRGDFSNNIFLYPFHPPSRTNMCPFRTLRNLQVFGFLLH